MASVGASLPGNGMYYHLAALGVLAVFILAGFAYREISHDPFLPGLHYIVLLEQATT